MKKSASASVVLFALLAGLLPLAHAQSTYTVTSTADTADTGTLRWAITQANANAGSTIAFTDNLGTVTLGSALPTITAATTIAGGTGNAVSGNNLHRIFFVNAPSAAVSISGLSLQQGYNGGANGYLSQGGNLGAGGAIYVRSGAVQISGVAFQGNSAVGGTGGAASRYDFRNYGAGVSSSYLPPYGIGGGYNSQGGAGSQGGFGGGGGGSSYYSAFFGGGHGGAFAGTGGTAYNGGSQSNSTSGNDRTGGGGGGAGLGGAIFVEGTNGASISFVGPISESGGTAIGGAGGTQDVGSYAYGGVAPLAGMGLGGGLFLTGGGPTILESGVFGGSIGISETTLIKNGPGTLTIGGGLSAHLGAILTLNDGVLQLGTSGGTSTSLLGTISGAGALSVEGIGVLTLTGSSPAYSGAVSLAGPQVFVGNTFALGTGTVSITGGEIHTDGTARTLTNPLTLGGSIVVGRSVTFTGNAALDSDTTFTANNPSGAADANTFFSGVISGSHGLTIAQGANGIGTGAIVLANDNTFTGGTTIASGRLEIGFGGATGSVVGDIVNHGALVINRSTDWSHSGNISGTGSLVKRGAGNFILGGSQTYAGGTTISGGTLTGSTSNLQGTIVNNAAVAFNQATAGTLTGVISGSGSLMKTGAGTLTLGGANTYSGATTIAGGTLVSTDVIRAGSNRSAALLLDATSLSATANPVTTWTDLSGNGRNAVAGGGSVTLGALSTGRAALVFGANSYFNTPLSSSGTAYTIFSVFEPNALSGNQSIAGSSQTGGLQFRVADNRLGLLSQGLAQLANSNIITNTSPTFATATVTSGAQSFYLGTAAAGTGAGGFTFSPGATFRIGTNAGVNESFNGDISLLVIFDSVLTPTQIATIQSTILAALANGTTFISPDLSIHDTSLPSTTALNITASGAALDISGQAQTLGSLAGVAGTNVYLGSRRLTVGADNSITTFAGNILENGGVNAGTGGSLVKVGTGTLNLTGSSDYSGGTTLEAGVLGVGSISALGTGSLALNGGTLRFLAGDADISTRSVTVGSAGTTLDLNGNNVAFSQPLHAGGSNRITFIGSGSLTLADVALPLGGPVTNNASLISTPSTNVTLPVLSGTGSVTLNAGSNVVTLPAGSAWDGTTNINTGTLKLSGTNNLAGAQFVNLANTESAILDLNNFDQNIRQVAGAGLIRLGSGTLTLSGYSAANTLSAKITGTGGVTFNKITANWGGTGSDFSGNTRVVTGQNVYLLNDNVLSPNSSVTVDNNGINSGYLMLQGTSQTAAGISGTGQIFFGGGTLTIGGTNASSTWSGSGTGPGTVVKNGTGTLTITSGLPKITLNEGGLVLATFFGGFGGVVSPIDIYGGTLTATRAQNFLATVSLYTDARIGSLLTLKDVYLGSSNAGITFGEISGLPSTDTTVSGVISGPAGQGISISAGTNGVGTRALVFSGANTYTGATTLQSGRLAVGSDANLGAATAPLAFSGGTLKLTGAVTGTRIVSVDTDGGTLESNGFSATFGGITGSGTLTTSGTGDLGVSGTSVFTGTFSLTSGAFIVTSTGDFQLGNGGTAGTLTAPLVTNGRFAFNRSDDLAFTQVVSGTGQLSQLGSGLLTLTASNTYSGGTTVAAGTLRLGHTTALGTSGNVTLSGGILDLNGFSQIFTQLNATGGTITNQGAIAAAVTLGVPSGTSVFQGNFTDGASAVGLTKTGDGTLTLGAANQYSGGTTITAGSLLLGHDQALGTGSVFFNGGTLQSSGGPRTIGNAVSLNADTTLSGAAALTLAGPVTLNGFKSLNVTNTAQTTISGAIGQGSPSILIKQGSGELQLTGANTYTGGTFIQAGTMRINNNTGSAFGTGAVTIAPGATLAGAGSFTGALQLNGTFSPGNSPGLASTGSQTWAGGGNYVWEINDAASPATSAGTRYDLLSITGALTITATSGSPFTINLTSLLANNSAGAVINFNSSVNSSYTIATATGGIVGFSSDKFSLNTTGFSNPLNGGSWSIGTLGNDLNLTFAASAIPEPSTYALIVGLLTLTGCIFRRRTRTAK